MIWSIAWRNIWRNKLRSLTIIIAVIFGLIGGIFSVALMNGMMEQSINSSIATEISNIQIHNPKYPDNKEIKYYIENAEQKVAVIDTIRYVKAACSRIKTAAMASTAVNGTGILISGINPEKEKLVTDLYTKIIEGNYFGENKMRSDPIIIGEKLAHKLKAKINSKIVITIQNIDNIITYGAFRIVGIYKTQNSSFDEMNVFVKKDDFADLLGFNTDNATEIALRLEKNNKTDEVATKLQEMYPDLKIQTWEQIRPEFKLFDTWAQQMLYLFLFIILLGLAFGIVNAMLMAIMERVREIGMLMAVGMNKRRVFIMIMLETVFLSFTGGIIGIAASFGIVEYFGSTGIDLSVVSEGLSAVGWSSTAYPSIESGYYLVIAIMVIITAILSSIYPAVKALKLNPAEAIREEI